MSNDNTDPGPTDTGFVPHLGAVPSAARYEPLTAPQAVDRVAAVGFDRADAELMVDQYLTANTAAFGTPPGDGWRVDPYDLAEIARGYEWVDHYRGETIADARARIAEYSAGYAQTAATIDREQEPGYAARIDREVVEWADRAREGHNPWSAPDLHLATDEGTFGELTDAQEHPEIEAAEQSDAAGPEVVGLVCPECEEDVVDRAPSTLVPYEAHGVEVPAYSHLDGEPLCPVMGPRGYQPADPMEVYAQAAVEQVHRAVSETPALDVEDGPDRADREDGGGGVPTAGWEPDRSDLAAIAAEQRVAAAHDAVTQTGTEPGRTTQEAEETTELDRRAQLAAWAHADTTDDHTGSAEHGLEQQR